jgi:hypothetical protein
MVLAGTAWLLVVRHRHGSLSPMRPDDAIASTVGV